jgi:hypothetical protein
VRRILRHRPSPALVIACVALLIALTGTGIAAVEATAPPNNSVGTAQLKNNAVTAAKIASNAVVAAKIASNAVVAAKIASNAVVAAKIGGNAVNSAKVQDGTLVKADFKAGELNDAFARFLNGPVAVPTSQTTIATLSVPEAGAYMIWGKAYLTGTSSSVNCRLEAGGDFDQTLASPSSGSPAALALLVVHTFNASGTVEFKCDGAVPGVSANFIKIGAMKVADLTNNG